MSSFFRRPHPPTTTPQPEPDPPESPRALAQAIEGQIEFVNRNAGRLPVESVVLARRVTDAASDVVDLAASAELEMQLALTVRKIVTDYLPTALRTYLALEADAVELSSAQGITPRQALTQQLADLWAGAIDLRSAAQSRDADALVSHGAFLRTKFSGSDLDL
ncbi:MAG TPA: hypothetical protein VGH01_01615 [Jatrophihabitantaceae bacterium]|jgi:hypothetical protein